MRRLHGFSLMEMMIVLTIVAVVAAASAPMVNKKLVRGASEKSPWVFVNGESIGYNIDNEGGIQDRKTATIGTNGRVPSGAGNPRLYIDTNSDTTPHILFGRQRGNLMQMIAGGDRNNIIISNNNQTSQNSIVIGNGTQASNFSQIIIGDGASSSMVRAVAIGRNTRVGGEESVAIGAGATTNSGAYATALGNQTTAGMQSIAVGSRASATSIGSIAIGGTSGSGTPTQATGNNSIAIGQNASAGNISGIALGLGSRAAQAHSIALGANATTRGSNTIAIGHRATVGAAGGLAIGRDAFAATNAIAIGHSADNGVTTQANSTNSVAIGYGSRVSAANGMALGVNARVNAAATNSVAIGRGAIASQSNTIVLGDENTTVVIPGAVEFASLHVSKDLVVDYNCVVNRLGGEFIFRAQPGPPKENSIYGNSELSRIFMGDDRGGDDNTRTLRKYGWRYSILDYTITSDRRLKNVGKEFTSGLEKLKKLQVFNYTFKDNKDKTPHVGIMAQDLQKIFPDAVVKGEDGFLRIRMEDMFYAVINAVKELDNRTSAQEKKIKELEKRIEELEKKL